MRDSPLIPGKALQLLGEDILDLEGKMRDSPLIPGKALQFLGEDNLDMDGHFSPPFPSIPLTIT